jgi:hypothetical protein
MPSVARLRLLTLSSRQALPWRWDLAQLALGYDDEWPQPGSLTWAQRTQSLATGFVAEEGRIALAFEGYALVGALWTLRTGDRDLVCGPYVMPQYQGCELAQLLLRIFRA